MRGQAGAPGRARRDAGRLRQLRRLVVVVAKPR